MLGPPDTVVELGETEVSEEIFMDYLSSLGESTYRFPFFNKTGKNMEVYTLVIRLAYTILLNRNCICFLF